MVVFSGDLCYKLQTANCKLKGEISILTTKIAKINLQIKAVNLSIEKLGQEVTDTNTQINQTEGSITSNKNNISNTLQSIYQNDKADTIQILLKSKQLSDFFGNISDLTSVQDNLRTELEDLIVARNELADEKDQLDRQRLDAEEVRSYQASQQAQIQQIKSEKNILLQATKGQVEQYKSLVVEKQKAAADIRNRIFRLLGGGELQFGDAVKIAAIAEKATGVRSALILSVLTQESATSGVIGRNLGKCYYNTPARNNAGTVMNNTQKPVFLALISSLGESYKPESTPVSCPIYSDGAYGGAIGPAQFLPTTWNLYKDRVAAVTGANPANPFNNLDAFTATALYLSDGFQGCKTIYSSLFHQEDCVAAKYYAGGKWRSYTSPGRYGYRVAERAQNLQKDIDLLNNN